ncbi:S41 family peptidase [Bacillaceae bacterium W0354]
MEISKKSLLAIIAFSFIVGSIITVGAIEIFDLQSDSAVVEEEKPDTEDQSQQDNQKDEQVTKENKKLDLIEYAIMLLEENYVDEVDKDELYEGAIEGLVAKLGDPYSEYMDPETTEMFNQQLESTFEGIGAEVTKQEGYITIIAPLKDAPAEKAGIRPNDRVLAVDGVDLEGYTVFEAVALIRGEKGTEVTLTIERPGEEKPFDVVIKRDTIPLTTVYSDVLTENGKKVGILEIRSFAEGTAKEFRDELLRLENEEKIDGLVIDVRGNPGGLFNSVEDILSNFMEGEAPFVQMARRDEEPYVDYLNGRGKKDYPITVLVNEGSASASEILAAAMKEVGGYDIVGTTTFGKGTVQQTMALGDGMLKLTILHWLSPEGNQINEVGVEPTVPVEQPDFYHITLIRLDEPLKINMNSAEVVKMQVMLDAIGYDPGRNDGYFDAKTEQALKQFQSDEGLSATGVLDEESKNALEELVIEAVNDRENDWQLQKAVDVMFSE